MATTIDEVRHVEICGSITTCEVELVDNNGSLCVGSKRQLESLHVSHKS